MSAVVDISALGVKHRMSTVVDISAPGVKHRMSTVVDISALGVKHRMSTVVDISALEFNHMFIRVSVKLKKNPLKHLELGGLVTPQLVFFWGGGIFGCR